MVEKHRLGHRTPTTPRALEGRKLSLVLEGVSKGCNGDGYHRTFADVGDERVLGPTLG